MIIVALAMFPLGQFQQCEGLVFVPRSVTTALLPPSPTSVVTLYAHSQPMHETNYAAEPKNSGLNTDKTEFNGDDLMAAFRKEMLDLVYERSMQRFLE